jgi:hypothetical protein
METSMSIQSIDQSTLYAYGLWYYLVLTYEFHNKYNT